MNAIQLPSHFQIGDKVSIRLRPQIVVESATVAEVHFTESKVYYDLDADYNYESPSEDGVGTVSASVRLSHVDSAIVSDL